TGMKRREKRSRNRAGKLSEEQAASILLTRSQELKSVRENWVVPPGLRSFFPLFPALKRWAKLVRPSGAAFSSSSFHRIAKTSVLTHTLKRWAKLVRPSGAVLSSSSFPRMAKTPVLTHTLKRWAKLGRPSGAEYFYGAGYSFGAGYSSGAGYFDDSL